MTGQGCSHEWAQAHPLGSQAQPIGLSFFSPQGFSTDRPVGWSQTIPQVKNWMWRSWASIVTNAQWL